MLALPALLPVVVGSIPFVSQPPFTAAPFIYPKLLTLSVLVAISALAWGYGVIRGTQTVRSVPGGWWLAGFMGLAAASTAFAMSPSMAFFGGRYQLIGLMSLLLAVGVFLLMTQVLTSPGRIRDLSWSTVAGGAVVAVVTILQARDLDPLGMARTNLYILHRGPSLLGNPDFTGTYLVVPVLIAAALAMTATDSRLRLAAWAGCGVTFAAVAVSLTRGAWVGVAVGGVAFLVAMSRSRAGRRRAGWVLGGAGLVLAVAVALRGGLTTFLGRFSDLSSATTAGDGRFVLWRDALGVVAKHPLLGTGPDSYRLGWYGARSLESVRLSGVTSITEDPHNVVLLLMATLGVPAALMAVGMIGATLYASAKSAFARKERPGQLVHAGWWSALLGLCAALFFGANTITATVMLFLAAAVVVAPRVREQAVSESLRRGLAAAGTLVALGLLVLSAMSFVADVRLGAAMRSGDVAGMEAAARTAPWHVQARYQATFTAANKALVGFRDGEPQAADAVASAQERIADLIEMNPHEYYSHSLLAFFLAQRGAIEQSTGAPQATETLEQARSAAEKALEISPVSPEAAYLKAFSEYHLGDVGAAVKTLQPVWDADPRFASSGLLYVEVLAQQGSRARALDALATMRKRYPGDPAIEAVAKAVEATSTP